MRALAVVLLLVAIAVPAAACPPMRARLPVDPVVALEQRLGEGDDEILREVLKSAQWIARQRSRQPEQRARALAVAASARFQLGETRAATLTMERALAVDRDAARAVAMVPDELLAGT